MLRNRGAMWASIVAFPPLGLILLWMRGDWGILRRILATLAVLTIAILELYFVYGLRLDWNGNMSQYSISFGWHAKHYSEVEASRARQQAEAPPAPRVEEPVVEPKAAPAPVLLKPAAVSYWTDFRGPRRDGVYSEAPIDTAWPPPMLWKEPVGGGYASFTFGEGQAYTIEQRRDKEVIAAYDPLTGRELWKFSYPASFDEVLGGPGPRATPVYHDGLVYSLGANGDFYALSARNGKPKWSKNILTDNDATNVHWAMAGSPLIMDDMVIVTPGGTSGKSIVAYNRLTGAPVWRSLNDRAAYTSPILATFGGRREIVWISAERVVGLSPEDGKLIWEYPFPAQMDMNCSQPVVIDDTHVLLSSSSGPGAALLEISGSGAREIWKNNRMKNKFNSSVLHAGYLYGLDETILECMDPKTGEVKWKGGRYGYGQVLLAGDFLIVLTESGELALVRATPEGHRELARFAAIEGKTWNIPAIDHGLLLVRNASEMACFRIGKAAE
jgi:outer membrane protein assembly factor BamB